jgi:hypothetical protein
MALRPPNKCSLCSKSGAQSVRLMLHAHTRFDTINEFPCVYIFCAMGPADATYVASDKWPVATTNKCSSCSKSCARRVRLMIRAYTRFHTFNECSLCLRLFAQRAWLMLHMYSSDKCSLFNIVFAKCSLILRMCICEGIYRKSKCISSYILRKRLIFSQFGKS